MRHLHAPSPVLHLVSMVDAVVGEMPLEQGFQPLRQHRHPVLIALRLPDRDLVGLEVDVLDPQLQNLAEPHAGAVKQQRHHQRHSFQLRQHSSHFVGRQHDRKPFRSLGPYHALEQTQRLLEHSAGEEEKGAECLVLGRGRHVAVHGEMRQEGVHLRHAQVTRMAFAVKEHEPANPADVGLAGVGRQMASDRGVCHAIEQPRWFAARLAGGVHWNDLTRRLDDTSKSMDTRTVFGKRGR